MKKTISQALPDILVVGGAVLLACGIGMMHLAAGVITAGVLSIAGGWIVARNGGEQTPANEVGE